jgi:hypothetical protein
VENTISDLTVITVVEHDRGTLDLMIRSILRFTDPKPSIILCCNNQQEYTNISIKYRDLSVAKVILNTPELMGGSNRHGSGLNAAFKQVKTKRTAIVESDCVVLLKGWDRLAPGSVIKAASKVSGFYHVCFAVFETDALAGTDFRPGKEGNRANRSYKVWEDVGWRMADSFTENEVDVLDFVDCKTTKAKMFRALQSDEFHKNGEVIAAHFGRGSNLGGKAQRSGFQSNEEQLKCWMEKVDGYLK